MKRTERISHYLRLPMRAAVLGLIAAYRILLSPLLTAFFGPACRFEPSCSLYASEAVSEHGILRGGLMAVRRLLRCHPLGGHGYDPVLTVRPSGSVPGKEIFWIHES